jgi:hypothetical protein
MSAGGHGGGRAERILVRILLALRREARCSPDRDADARRAEALADVILSDFPRRVLPFGMAALVVITVLCALPLLRDAAVATQGAGASGSTVAHVVESSLRDRGRAMSDGIDAIRAVVAPFAPDTASDPSSAPEAQPVVAPPADASAPFRKS